MRTITIARVYCFDLAAMAFLFVSVSITAGRVWRFPFDDEIATLFKIEPDAAREIITNFPATDDIHPPFSYLIFHALRRLRFSKFLFCIGCHGATKRGHSPRRPASLPLSFSP